MNLRTAGDAADPFKGLEEPMVLVADEVTPSVIAQLDWSMLAALVTDAGSWTYHTAILARSLHIPAVAGLHNASAVILPGRTWRWTDRPGRSSSIPTSRRWRRSPPGGATAKPTSSRSTNTGSLPAVTQDGVCIRLEANIEAPDDAGRAAERGAEGIGLFRSEFLLAGGGQGALAEETSTRLPAADRGRRRPAGDRPDVRRQRAAAPIEHAGVKARAPLGLRGIRLSLALDEIFQAQLRALLRAAARSAPDHVPVRVGRERAAGGTRGGAARGRHPAGARHRAARGADRRDDRGPVRGAEPISLAPRRISSASGPTT